VSVDQRLREAELAFLNAPFRDGGWTEAVAMLAAVTGSRSAQLLGIGGPLQMSLNIVSDIPRDPHGHLHNPVLHGKPNWRIGVTDGPMLIRHEPDYARYRGLFDTSDYDDAVSDLGIPFGCQAPLLFDSSGLLGLALLRSARNGPCSADTLELFTRLSRSAQRAVRVQLALGQELAETMLSGTAIATEATILLDRYGQLAALTPAAERLFDHPHGLHLGGQRLHLANAREDHFLGAALARLLASDGVSGPILHQCEVGRSADRPAGRWRLYAVRLPAVPHGFGFEPQLAITLTDLQASC